MKGGVLVCGTHSDAGKSVTAAGICRWLHRSGVSVAPFKAQNMALNSVVTPGGCEIGRSQAVQAAAAGVEPSAAMNPILIKPSGERHSQLVVMGKAYAEVSARSYQQMKDELRPIVAAALAELRERYDVVVCEGAGSPAEINLREHDLVNLGLAREAQLPVVLVADIDRGGMFASLFGTLALLEPADQAQVAGFIVNRFRGDGEILAPGLARLAELTGRPTFGVLPHVEDLWLDAEDSLALERGPLAASGASELPALADSLEIAVVGLRWISNFTDLDALAAEPGVRVRLTRSAADVERADLVVLPGTKATVEDLAGLREGGLEGALRARAARGAPILGICGGYQMLGRRILDDVESDRGMVEGLGLLPLETVFAREKLLRRRTGSCPWLGTDAGGYEIRHGRVALDAGACELLFVSEDGEPEGCRTGTVLGTSWHGVFEHDAFRRALLGEVARVRGRRFAPGSTPFADLRAARLDLLGDLVVEHLDTAALGELIERGASPELPVIAAELRGPTFS